MQAILFLTLGVIIGVLIEARYGPAIQGIHARLDADVKAADGKLVAQTRVIVAYMREEIAKVRSELTPKPAQPVEYPAPTSASEVKE